MERYYTPDESEFHLGFEYEQNTFIPIFNDGGTWEQRTYHGQILGTTRVKYLDGLDFARCGFNTVEQREANFDVLSKFVRYRSDKMKCEITYVYSTRWLLVTIDKSTIFAGRIRNINELIVLMKQLCITE